MVIKTNISSENKKVGEMLNSVIGQMSDGIWENSNLKRYWMFADATILNGEWVIEISDESGEWTYERIWQVNAFRKMSANKILEFFARKLKQIADIEIHDNDYPKNFTWRADSSVETQYLNYVETITFGDVYQLRKHLLKVAKEVA